MRSVCVYCRRALANMDGKIRTRGNFFIQFILRDFIISRALNAKTCKEGKAVQFAGYSRDTGRRVWFTSDVQGLQSAAGYTIIAILTRHR